MAVGFEVLVEQDLLSGDLGTFVELGGFPVVGSGDRAAAVHAVLLTLEAASVVPPCAAPQRHREVGLLGAFFDLVEDPLPQRFLIGGFSLDMRVFGLEVGNDLGVGLVAHPLVVVNVDVVVVGPLGVYPLGTGRFHALTPIQSANFNPEIRS